MSGQNQSAKVTVEELPAAPGAIEAVSTSTLATAGWTARGRTDQIVTAGSYAEYEQKMGGFWANSFIPYAASGFFDNDGKSMMIRRVVPSDAGVAQVVISDAATAGSFTTRTLSDPLTTLSGSAYNIKVQVDAFAATTIDVTGDLGVAGSYTLSSIAGRINTALTAVDASLANVCTVTTQTTSSGTKKRLTFTSPSTGVTSQIIFSTPATNDASLKLIGYTGTLTRTGLASKTNRFTCPALGGGTWGNDLRLSIVGNPNYKTSTGGWSKFDVIISEELNSDGNFNVRESYLEVVLDVDTDPAFISNYIGTRSSYLTVTEGTSFGIPFALTPVSHANEVVGDVLGNGTITAFTGTLKNLPNRRTLTITAGAVTGTDNGNGQITGTGITTGTINYTTGDIAVTFTVAPAANIPVYAAYTSTANSEVDYDLTGGTEGTGPITRSLISDPALASTKGGIYAFNDVTDQVLNFALPDFAGVLAVHNDLISWAEARKDIFCILDPAIGLTADNVVSYVRDTAQFNSSYAALYWPWLSIADSLANGAPKNIPPSGHVAGIYARTDATRNVAKAPAGVADGALRSTLGFERTISSSDRDTVYPARVNPMIGEKQTGRAVWGGRTLSLDRRWKYIQARRFFLFVEKSIYVNSWWAVFETIGPDLFSRITTSVDGFLRGLLANNYFPTKKKEDAYKVVCDSTNNDDTTADNGEVIIDVFLAPSKPGEFVKFRFRQKLSTSSAAV